MQQIIPDQGGLYLGGRRPSDGGLLTGSMPLNKQVIKMFIGTACHFVTLNPYKKAPSFKRFQKIGPVGDWLRRHNFKSYFIVQETNKEDLSAHYHILCRYPDDFKSWESFKGMKSHEQKVGGNTSGICFDRDDVFRIEQAKEEAEERRQDWIRDELGHRDWLYKATFQFIKNVIEHQRKSKINLKARERRSNSKCHVTRVVDYMFKELSPPTLYLNYILPAKT